MLDIFELFDIQILWFLTESKYAGPARFPVWSWFLNSSFVMSSFRFFDISIFRLFDIQILWFLTESKYASEGPAGAVRFSVSSDGRPPFLTSTSRTGQKKPFQERIKSYNIFPFLESKSRVNDIAIANIYGSKINVMVTIIHFQFKKKCNGNGSKVNVMLMTIHYQFKRNCNGNGSFWILFVFEQCLLTLGSLAPVHHVSKVSKFLQNHERWFQHLLPSGHFS